MYIGSISQSIFFTNMTLAYLWIENYRNLDDIHLHFCTKYLFKFNNKNNPDVSLQIKEKKTFHNSLSDNSQISSLSAIVGQNGTGKSNILRAICHIFDYNLSEVGSFLLVLEDNKSKQTKLEIIYHSFDYMVFNMSIDAPKDNLSIETVYSFPYLLPSKVLVNNHHKFNHKDFDQSILNPIKVAYFTNTFDQSIPNLHKSIVDLSLIKSLDDFTMSDFKDLGVVNIDRPNYTIKKTLLGHFQDLNTSKLLEFISDNKDNTIIPFDIPNAIIITFNKHKVRTKIKNNQVDNSSELLDLLNTLFSAADNSVSSDQSLIKYFLLFSYLTLINDKKIITSSLLEKIKSIDNYKDTVSNSKIIFETIKELLFKEYVDLNYSKHEERIKSLISSLEKKSFTSRSGESSTNYTAFTIEISQETLQFLRSVFKFQNEIKMYTFTVSWEGGLSSGQYSMLSQFARIYTEPRLKNHLGPKILLIDEGELYLHPEWQRTYINNLLKFISSLENNKNWQIILTSHSPFILSDLASDNLILLKNEGNKIVSKASEIKTFGANIHELFTNSFFLPDGLMGQYSQSIIREIIEDLASYNEIDIETYNKYKDKIDMIGEPFIQSKLFDLIARKSNDMSVINKIIEHKNNEIEQLMKIRNQKKDDQDR